MGGLAATIFARHERTILPGFRGQYPGAAGPLAGETLPPQVRHYPTYRVPAAWAFFMAQGAAMVFGG
jgi:hypothetical protein